MKKLSWIMIAAAVGALIFASIAIADGQLSAWPYVAQIELPKASSGYCTFAVPLPVLDKSRDDLADLRLIDAQHREIPYAVRVRREIDEQKGMAATTFNQVTVGNSNEVSVDLGDHPNPHNEVEVQTAGANFRRKVDVEGSDNGKDWKLLQSGAVIFRFQNQNNTVESDRVSYPISRYRFLRLRVYADELTDKTAPPITLASVSISKREKGELTIWSTTVSGNQLLRNQGAPASSWTIDLGYYVPIDRLFLNVGDASFSRPFQLEVIDDPQNTRLAADGELTRHLDEKPKPIEIRFDKEIRAHKLRLLVTDYNNQALSLSTVNAAAPARQIVFELKGAEVSPPLRLFFGNQNAAAPHYDFETELPAKLAASPQLDATMLVAQVQSFIANPEYKPQPLPLTERVPWLIYVVLTASSVALALILINLAKRSLAKGDEDRSQGQAEARTG